MAGRTPKTAARLAEYARARGFQVFAARSPEEAQAFYNGCDLHVGSRLHAHLYFLSQAKRSFLSAVDGRSAGMARTLGFPLCDPAAWDRHFDYDFEQFRTAARVAYQSMARFVWSLKEKLG
jgi:hypothetical protein